MITCRVCRDRISEQESLNCEDCESVFCRDHYDGHDCDVEAAESTRSDYEEALDGLEGSDYEEALDGFEESDYEEVGGIFAYPIFVFTIVGFGLGLTATILTLFIGGEENAIASGFISLATITVTSFFGPLIAAIVGTQISSREQASPLIDGFFGCSVGFIIMLFVVLIIQISSFGGIVFTGAEAGAGASTTGGGLDLKILLVAIPTGLTGAATTAF